MLGSHEQLQLAACRVSYRVAKIKLPSLDGKDCGLIQCPAGWAFDITGKHGIALE